MDFGSLLTRSLLLSDNVASLFISYEAENIGKKSASGTLSQGSRLAYRLKILWHRTWLVN